MSGEGVVTPSTNSQAEKTHEDLRKSVEVANIPVLLMILHQFTGDPKWLEAPYRPAPQRGLDDNDDGGLSPSIQNEIREAAVLALARLNAGERPQIAVPSEERVLIMMSALLGEEIPNKYGRMMREELARFAAEPLDEYMELVDEADEHNAIVIGMSLAGIVAAKHLEEAGLDYVILERNTSHGGSWLVNKYPGAGVDTPSHLYSFSFRNNDWKHHFVLRDEIVEYFGETIKELKIAARVQFDTQVVSLTWLNEDKLWQVETRKADGSKVILRARIVISAVGIFGQPKIPDLPGLAQFGGTQFHPADWPEQLDLSGKRVVVVGTGASAMQLVPAIADKVGHLTILQRSPQWIAPFEKFGAEISVGARYLLSEFPLYRAWYWVRLFWQFGDKVLTGLRSDPDWTHPDLAMNARNMAHRRLFERYVREQVGDRTDLLEKVIPDYPPYGKRMLLDNGWFQALRKSNVDLITQGVSAVEPTGVITQSGEHIPADVIVWSTGYEATRFLSSFDVIGRGGVKLRDAWGDDNPTTYLGVATPGFPNLFMLGGPHSFPGAGSFMFFMELQMRYVRRLIGEMISAGGLSIEPRLEPTADYNAEVDELHSKMVWTHPRVESYFRNSTGRVCVIMPFLNVEYWNKLRDVELSDFKIEVGGRGATSNANTSTTTSAGAA